MINDGAQQWVLLKYYNISFNHIYALTIDKQAKHICLLVQSGGGDMALFNSKTV
jgi:hypothetical protein